jgi:nitroimidazol reductase NimA-like FMN-containing flavoprotein (pyridoxamine 5'-phosphate oxidase superfamily)
MSDTVLDQLAIETCLDLLRADVIGRIAVIDNGFPVVLPVNFRLVENRKGPWILVRTRPGNVIDQAPLNAAFEIDGIDAVHRTGWSVLVRGPLSHLDADAVERIREHVDPHPWLTEHRDSWLVIKPVQISGRRLRVAESEWAFHIRGYL